MIVPDAITERLALAAEEHGEAVQALMKAQRHGLDSNWKTGPTNRHSIEMEFGDVLAAMDIMVQAGDVDAAGIEAARITKLSKVQQFLHHDENKTAAKAALINGGLKR